MFIDSRHLVDLLLMLAALRISTRPVASFVSTTSTTSSLRTHSRRYFQSTSTTPLAMTTKKVLVPIGDGSEEIETACIQDTLVRFGCDVTVASVKPGGELLCKMSRGLLVQAHMSITQAAKDQYDLIVLPGGVAGAESLRDSEELQVVLKQHIEDKKLYAAVCAAPALVLSDKGYIPEGATATCFPKFREHLKLPSDERVVVHENMITSQGPGTSLEFALVLGETLFGKEKRDEIAQQLLVKE